MCRKLIYLSCFVLLLGLVMSSIASAALPGLIGWWKLDEMAGTIAYDSSGLGNDGTLGPEGDPQWVAGYFGGALDLDGDNDYIEINSIADDITDDKFSIMAWIKTTQTGDGNVIGSNHSDGGHDVVIGVDQGLLLVEADNANRYPPTINDNQWHHIAYVRDGNIAYAYTDGVLVGTETPTKDPWTEPRWSIGQEWDSSPSDEYDGIVDDVQFYNRPLTAAEIVQVMIGVPSGEASDPSPENEAIDVPREVVLGWKPGVYAAPINGHKVYLSENFDDVSNGIGGITQSATSYAPGRLDFGTTYYWRIDEVNGAPDYTVYEGGVWSFTTELLAYPIENVTATASSQSVNRGVENTVNGSGLDESGLLHDKKADDNMWLSDIAGPQPSWIEFEFDGVYKLHEMWVWNSNGSLEPMIGFGFKDVTIECSANGTDYTTLGTTAEFARAPGAPDYEHNTTIDMEGVPAKYVRLTANSNWGGILPQFGLSEVRFFYIPVNATEPYPDSGATAVARDVVLDWRAGREAATHDVYVSTDEQAVMDGTAPVATVTEASHGPLSLDLGVAHYWKINEVNEAETPTTWESAIWNFTTTDHLVVDDFESYNDLDPADPDSKRIFNVWIDGYGDATNGSLVGYENAPFCEQTIVNGGKQSMPFFYSNTGGAAYSEAELTLTPAQNWTEARVQILAVHFYGTAGNTGQLYAKINGTKVPYGGQANNLALSAWQVWSIDLASSGAGLQSVTKLAIGVDGNGASGTLYVDDIGLYVVAPAAVNEWRIAASSDEGEEHVLDGSMESMTSSDLELGYEDSFAPENLHTVGCRWVGVTVPKGATITEAWVQFSADDINDGRHIPDVSVIIEGELSPNPATFSSTASDISSRPTTTSQVVWDIPRWMTVHAKGPEERTPDISSIIQEIINQDGWAGNAIVLMFRDNPAKPSQGTREAEAFDGSASEAPLLHISYQ